MPYTRTMKEQMNLTPNMKIAFYRIRDGHYNSVDLTSAKALERRGLIRIRWDRRMDGKRVLALGRPYELMVDSLLTEGQ